jgi:hypothetical protein
MFCHSFAISVGIYRSDFSNGANDWQNLRPFCHVRRYIPDSTKNQRVVARHDFSLAWLEAEGNVSEGGLARLIGSGFNRGCALPYYSITEFVCTLAVYWKGVRSCRDVLYKPCHLGVSFSRGCYLLGE